jgi:hypothetical protein
MYLGQTKTYRAQPTMPSRSNVASKTVQDCSLFDQDRHLGLRTTDTHSGDEAVRLSKAESVHQFISTSLKRRCESEIGCSHGKLRRSTRIRDLSVFAQKIPVGRERSSSDKRDFLWAPSKDTAHLDSQADPSTARVSKSDPARVFAFVDTHLNRQPDLIAAWEQKVIRLNSLRNPKPDAQTSSQRYRPKGEGWISGRTPPLR